MRKSLLFGMVAGVIIVAAVIVITLNTLPKALTQTEGSQPAQQESQAQNQPPAEQPSSQNATPGTYTDYSATGLTSTKGTKVLFFHAPWCPQCRALDTSIKEGQIPSGVTIFKVDYDTNQVLRQKYGVTIQTTLVKVDDNGNLLAKYVAYDKPTLQALIDHLL